jgi:hypothetical protein
VTRRRQLTVRFHQLRAALWAVAYIVTVAVGIHDSVALVWFASVYANVVSDLTAAAATDDKAVLTAIHELRDEVAALREEVLRDRNGETES